MFRAWNHWWIWILNLSGFVVEFNLTKILFQKYIFRMSFHLIFVVVVFSSKSYFKRKSKIIQTILHGIFHSITWLHAMEFIAKEHWWMPLGYTQRLPTQSATNIRSIYVIFVVTWSYVHSKRLLKKTVQTGKESSFIIYVWILFLIRLCFFIFNNCTLFA